MTKLLKSVKRITPPLAPKMPFERTVHGVHLYDPYFGLREKKNSKVLAYLRAENRYTERQMKATEPFQRKLYKELLSRIKETDLSVPVKMDDYFY